MNSKEFLKSKLFALSAEYPSTFIKYYFDTFDNDHFVCIFPKSDLDIIISEEAQEIDQEFLKLFPLESLSFIEIDNNLMFEELVNEYNPNPMVEAKTINIARLLKKYHSQHYTEKSIYQEPLYLVRKIAKEDILIEREDDEFAFAA